MKTTSREMSERLVKAGWVKETYFVDVNGVTIRSTRLCNCDTCTACRASGKSGILPAPMLNEVLEELSYENFHYFYTTNVVHRTTLNGSKWWADFAEWLYTTMCSTDAAAEVWIQLRETRQKPRQQCGVCGSTNIFPGGSWSPAKCRDCGACECIDHWER